MVPSVSLLERLRSRHWRLTPQRQVVAEVLHGPHLHLSAEEIFARARRLQPQISLATVYNTLGELVAMGELLEVRTGTGRIRYDPNVTHEHHHLVCDSCGSLFDVEPEGLAGLSLSPDERHGFVVQKVEVTFRGHCPTCA